MDDAIRISNAEARKIIFTLRNGQIFTAVFTKKTNSERRVMNCRRGVKKNVSGAGLRFDPISRGLLPVFDCQLAREIKFGRKQGSSFRMISLDNLTELKANGKQYTVSN